MEPLRIFVAGPYCPYGESPHNALRVAQQNVDAAIMVANALHDMGHYAFVPHLTHYLHVHSSCSYDRYAWYYDYDNSFLDRWANALFFLRESPGADKELERAKGLGLPIFYCLEDVKKFVEGSRGKELADHA